MSNEPDVKQSDSGSIGRARNAPRVAGWQRPWRWLADHELIFLVIAGPFLLFPPRWAVWLLVPLLLPVLGRLFATGKLSRPSPMNLPTIALVLMALVGYSVSIDSAISWAKLWGIVLGGAVFFGLLNGLKGERELVWAGRMLILASGVIALLSLVATEWSSVRLVSFSGLYELLPRFDTGLPGSGVPRDTTLFHPREVGLTMAMLLPVTLSYLMFVRDRRWKVMAGIGALLTATILLLSQAIMGLFGIVLALALLAIWWRRRMVWLFLASGAALIVVVLAYGPHRLAMKLLDIHDPLGAGFVLRFDMWSRALDMIRDMPLSGTGLNTFPLVQSHFYTGYVIGPEVHAHNLYLQTALDLGLPGLAAFVVMIAAFYVTAYRAYRGIHECEAPVLLLGLAASVFAYLGGGLMDVVALGQKPAVLLWIIFGLVAAAGNLAANRNTSLTRPRLSAIVTGPGAIVAAVVMILLLVPGTVQGNRGVILTQKALYEARTSGTLPAEKAEKATDSLNRALQHHPGRAQFHAFLGSLYAWQGDHARAVSELERRVALDGPRALDSYAPFTRWQRRLANEPDPADWERTLRLYSNWMNRFPDRAELYILVASAQKRLGNESAADGIIRAGIERRAEPIGLLSWYQEYR